MFYLTDGAQMVFQTRFFLIKVFNLKTNFILFFLLFHFSHWYHVTNTMFSRLKSKDNEQQSLFMKSVENCTPKAKPRLVSFFCVGSDKLKWDVKSKRFDHNTSKVDLNR